MNLSTLKVSDTLTFSILGPPLSAGPLPTVFYFALSAQDSFQTDPYNQPARFLACDQIRLFTATLPGHEEGLKPENALHVWAEKMSEDPHYLTRFFEDVKNGIDKLLEQNLIPEGKLGAIGLSRGCLIASHIAALCPEIRTLCGFAPLTRLSHAKEFQNGPDASAYDLQHLTPKLYDRTIRFYIGNLDKRVGTEYTFELVQTLAKEAKTHRIHSPPIEMVIGPSIGYQGHGTGPQVFQAGVNWMKTELL